MPTIAPRIVGTVTMAPTETELWAVDFTPRLANTETLSNPAAKLTDIMNGIDIALDTLPSISGNKVQQWVGNLTNGRIYHLTLTATASGGNRMSEIIEIVCAG